MDQARKQELLVQLVEELASERGVKAPTGNADELWDAFRAFVNTRPPELASDAFLARQDELLQGLIAEAGVSTVEDAQSCTADGSIRLWRGDITTLAVDAIVNAANSQMLGCWVPGHYCIDNAIHTYAGVQLRRECYELMCEQGHEEPTGTAKITSAWNLPSKHVLHTVGPIANGNPTDEHCEQLASCYRSCLELARAEGLESVAFCCISTGVFGFPAREAARIAVETVLAWHRENQPLTTVFNVFSESDEAIYREVFGYLGMI